MKTEEGFVSNSWDHNRKYGLKAEMFENPSVLTQKNHIFLCHAHQWARSPVTVLNNRRKFGMEYSGEMS
jgi:hypothetical protein